MLSVCCVPCVLSVGCRLFAVPVVVLCPVISRAVLLQLLELELEKLRTESVADKGALDHVHSLLKDRTEELVRLRGKCKDAEDQLAAVRSDAAFGATKVRIGAW